MATQKDKSAPLRILTAVPICDGHDSPIITINLELARHGVEVIYLGYHCSATAIARAAVQEDVHGIGLSSYNGGHLAFFSEVLKQLQRRGGARIPVFGGGGGTITHGDEWILKRKGIKKIFFAGTSLDEICQYVLQQFKRQPPASKSSNFDVQLGKTISALTAGGKTPSKKNTKTPASFVLGVAGPGGAGKSTLIDELVRRFLERCPGRIAVLANDPSHPDTGGAILGDRATMIYAQHDRVFMRSIATRGHLSGISETTPEVIQYLRRSGEFPLILVESVGIGQESDPFQIFGSEKKFVDAGLLVMSPFYGGRMQLQKIGLLHGADFIAVNKCDHPASRTALAEIQERVESQGKNQQLFGTTAARHEDEGLDRLFDAICARAGLKPQTPSIS